MTKHPDRGSFNDLDQQSVNTIRFLAVDGVEKAGSGHPGMPMGAAPMAYVLWSRYFRHNPRNSHWHDRDRFILSAGHGSMLLYALLHLTGYDLPIEELQNFRQWGSRTPGHPEHFITDGVTTTTGPLGQGFANGVGSALAETILAERFNRDGFPIVDHYTYAIVSDGDMMEGISHEAASLAGHLGLGKLIYFYDDNKISIDGRTDLSFTEDVGKRFDAYGWQVLRVEDGNDLDAIEAAINEAQADTGRPTLIIVSTIIGFGSPNKADTASAHGEPLGKEEVVLAKRNLGWPEDRTFFVPDDVFESMHRSVERGGELEGAWNELMDSYRSKYPDLAAEYDAWQNSDLPSDWESALPDFEPGESIATRAASGKVLNAIAEKVGILVGGSADLTPSNKTDIKARQDYQKDSRDGLYIRFGVREHAMASICNGMALHHGIRPYCGTFLIFSDYLRPALRLSALMGVPVTYVFTHDSIGLGEDGPTHQPVEHLMALRAIPGLNLIRPADAVETAEAWQVALELNDRPTALALTRQNLTTFDRKALGVSEGVKRGAYILRDCEGTPDIILIGTGSEVELAMSAAEELTSKGHGVRVVSMPSWDLFDAQEDAYQEHVLPSSVSRRLAIEAGVTLGWERYTLGRGRAVGLDRFGASAPADVLFREFGFTTENVVDKAMSVLKG